MTYTPSFDSQLDDDPGSLGLTFLAEVGDEGGYEYDFTRAWVDAAGAVYLANTSGCSCGSPFDELSSLADLIPVDTGTLPWLSALKQGDHARPDSVGDAKWTIFVATLRAQLLGVSNKRFDREAYETQKAKEAAEEASRVALRKRREDTRAAMVKVAERMGMERPFPWWPSSHNDELYDYVIAAQQFDVEEVLLVGATLHAMAFGQMEQATS